MPKNEFYTPIEVLETMSSVFKTNENNPNRINQNIVANHLTILSLALQKFQNDHFQTESKFYQDLYRLCQNQKKNL